MTDEIKEMLDYLKNNTFIPDEAKRKYKILHRDEVNKLLDYITNLQEKINKANEAISSILYIYDERMYEYCDVNYIEKLRKLKKELSGDYNGDNR